MSKRPTAERVRSLLDYNEETGIFTWKVRRGSKAMGAVAGSEVDVGNGFVYVAIRLDKTLYYAHQLAYLYMTGNWPPNQIDHKNRNGLDNSWSNLRPATRAQNALNMNIPKHNSSGYLGIRLDKRNGNWIAVVRDCGRERYIGTFNSPIAAARARDEEAKKVHGEFARLNF
jgi:hypothetical protein